MTFFSTRSVLRTTIAVTAVAGLAACGSTGGGGGGGGGASGASTIAAHNALYDQYTDLTDINNAPTSDMPTGGSASFSGTVVTDVIDSSSSAKIADVIGDVNLDVAFSPMTTDGNDSTDITGTVTNIRGTDAGGNAFEWDATMSTAHSVATAAGGGTLLTNQSTVAAPAVGNVTTRSGSMMVNLSGDITAANAPELGGAEGTALMTLGGSCFDTGCKRSVGTASLAIDDTAVGGLVDYSGSGTYIVEQ